jgi:hypothetical protein
MVARCAVPRDIGSIHEPLPVAIFAVLSVDPCNALRSFCFYILQLGCHPLAGRGLLVFAARVVRTTSCQFESSTA